MSAVSTVGSEAWASVAGASKSATGAQIESARSTPDATVAMSADRRRDRAPIRFPLRLFCVP